MRKPNRRIFYGRERSDAAQWAKLFLAANVSLPILESWDSSIVLDERELVKLLARGDVAFFVRHGDRFI